jgi:hypothetical protein
MKTSELTLNCQGKCGNRLVYTNLLLLQLKNGQELEICRDCINNLKYLTKRDIEFY